MSDQSSAELEQEAEAARERVAGTAESIRRKLTAGQMIDEFAGMFTGGDLSGALGTLKTQVRDNPLPVALVGAGIAWLAFGKGVTGQQASPSYGHAGTRPVRPQAADAARGPQDQGTSIVSSVVDGAQSAAESVSDVVGKVTDGLSATADRLRHGMLTGSSHMPRSASAAADQEPLLIAAIGLTLGAVAGAMLPASELEKEQIGPHAERLREGAKEMVDRGLDSAGRVASKAYDALKEEADRQGLAPDGATIGERVGSVVRSAAQSAEDAARDELGVGDEDSPQKS